MPATPGAFAPPATPLLLLLLLLCVGGASSLSVAYVEANARQLFSVFKRDHGRRYATAAEEAHRYGVFRRNMLDAAALEATQAHGASFGANDFADMTDAEFAATRLRYLPDAAAAAASAGVLTGAQQQQQRAAGRGGQQDPPPAPPPTRDWRAEKKVTHIKNQGDCGSCWAFAVVGSIESMWAIAGHNLTSLSEQELVSCDGTAAACHGGNIGWAFEWLVAFRHGQVFTEASFPYTSGAGQVPPCRGGVVGATMGHVELIIHNEQAIEDYVGINGPVSVAVDARVWKAYKSGVLSNCCGGGLCYLNHGVVVVGYTADYWIIKNSWGPKWGEAGYIRLKKGDDECGITAQPASCSPP